MKKPNRFPKLKNSLVKLALAVILLGTLLCVQGCSSDDADTPWWLPAPWLPVG